MKKLLLLLAGAAVLSAAPALVGGPFVVKVTRNTATVVWIVKSDELTLHPPAGAAQKKSPPLAAAAEQAEKLHKLKHFVKNFHRLGLGKS